MKSKIDTNEASRLASVWCVMSDNGGSHSPDNLHSIWGDMDAAMKEATKLSESSSCGYGVLEVAMGASSQYALAFNFGADQ